MATLVAVQIAAFAHSGGFPAAVLPTAVAIALAESHGNTSAKGGPNSNGSYDWGLFQINDVHNPSEAQKTDPLLNSQMAFSIYKTAGGFTPWATYNHGTYKSHLSDATAAVKTLQKLGPAYERSVIAGHATIDSTGPSKLGDSPIISNPIDGVSSAITGFSATIAKVSSNIGIIIVAVALLILGILLLSRNTTAGKAIKTGIKVATL